MNDRFFKIFFLSKDDLKKNNNEQRAIVEKKLTQAMKFSKQTQNQGIIRVIEDFAKEKGIAFVEQIKFQQQDVLEKPLIFQPTVFVTKDRDWLGIFERFKSENLKIIPNQNLEKQLIIKTQQLNKSCLRYQTKGSLYIMPNTSLQEIQQFVMRTKMEIFNFLQMMKNFPIELFLEIKKNMKRLTGMFSEQTITVQISLQSTGYNTQRMSRSYEKIHLYRKRKKQQNYKKTQCRWNNPNLK